MYKEGEGRGDVSVWRRWRETKYMDNKRDTQTLRQT